MGDWHEVLVMTPRNFFSPCQKQERNVAPMTGKHPRQVVGEDAVAPLKPLLKEGTYRNDSKPKSIKMATLGMGLRANVTAISLKELDECGEHSKTYIHT
uniref:SFRICE_006211 n=1 Tax=Spodoptera frugiperda TaxID=7108 RepID=A0A2H1V880_SPOFR